MTKFTNYIIICLLIVSYKKANEPTQVENSNSELEAFIPDYYSVMPLRDWHTYKTFFADKAVLTTIWQNPNDFEPKLLTNTISNF